MLNGTYATVTEAAAELGISRQRVHGLIKSGQLVAEAIHDRLLAIPRKSLEAIKKVDRPVGVHVDKRPRAPRRRAS